MIFITSFSLLPSMSYAANTALMELIQILKNKGSITEEEFQLLQKAAATDEQQQTQTTPVQVVTTEKAPEKVAVANKTEKSGDSWTDKLTLKGDMRLRYQTQENDPGVSRDRTRIRFRLGMTALPSDGWEVGGGLASGAPDLRSSNQTITDTFSKKPVNLDYAYAQYKFNDSFKLIAGKFKFPAYLYTASDYMWDGDVNPEGFAGNFSHKSALGTTFINGGYWILTENANSRKDPYLMYGQIGQNFEQGDVFGSLAGTYYSFKEILARNSFTTAGSNTDYHFGGIYSVAGELGLSNFLNTGIKTSVLADWANNSDTKSAKDSGLLLGVKVSEGDWAFRYLFGDLEVNAWPDIFADSERYEGLTGIKGHELVLEYEIMKNVMLAIDYYTMSRSAIRTDQDLLHMDLNVKF